MGRRDSIITIRPEPKIHSDINECGSLTSEHPLFDTTIYCIKCCLQVYDSYHHECDATWVETGKGNFCLKCFYESVLDENLKDNTSNAIDSFGLSLDKYGFSLDVKKVESITIVDEPNSKDVSESKLESIFKKFNSILGRRTKNS